MRVYVCCFFDISDGLNPASGESFDFNEKSGISRPHGSMFSASNILVIMLNTMKAFALVDISNKSNLSSAFQQNYLDTIMSDSEHSTVTYTSVPEDDSDIGSPGVEGPIFQDPPSPDYVPGPEGPPSPDYVPGPEEPEQAPPSPIYIPFVPEPIPSPPLPIPPPPPIIPTYAEGSLGSRAAGIRQRDALPSHVHETEMLDMCFPLRKRPCRTTPWPGILRSGKFGSSPGRRMSRELGLMVLGYLDDLLDEPRYDRALLKPELTCFGDDRPFHRRTAVLMEEEARLSRPAWQNRMDAIAIRTQSRGILLQTTVIAQQSEIVELQAADQRRQTVISELLKADYRRQRQLVEALKIVKSLQTQMIELQTQQGPAKDPAEPELPEEASSSS
ncbi:hypothetical protein Tco_1283862 [Tanacetum coccineum]